MSTQTILNTDPNTLFAALADQLFTALSKIPKDDEIVLGLCGGRSIIGLLSAVKNDDTPTHRAILARTQFFMVDERLVPLDHADSNYGQLYKLLLKELVEQKLISESQLHPFVTQKSSVDSGTGAYLKELERFGGKFTAIVLGIGEDGHVAGLFPNHPVLHRSEALFMSYFESPKPPPHRMSATIALLQTAKCAIVLATGEGKRSAYEMFRREKTTVWECPSVLVREIGEVVVGSDLEGNFKI